MELYHGSNTIVRNPDLSYSHKSRDFGRGFYLTSDLNQAKTWANKKTVVLENGNPNVSIFDFEENDALKIKKFNGPSEEWFDYVVKNRTDGSYFDDYDVVIGCIANDSTYEVLNLYIREVLTKEEAILRLKTFKLKDQYTFKTDKALEYLKFKGAIE